MQHSQQINEAVGGSLRWLRDARSPEHLFPYHAIAWTIVCPSLRELDQEDVWNLLKRRELKNLCCPGLAHLRSALVRAKERLRHRKAMLQSCFLHALGTL